MEHVAKLRQAAYNGANYKGFDNGKPQNDGAEMIGVGVGIGIGGTLAGLGDIVAPVFSEASMFASGETGLLPDFADTATMFQDQFGLSALSAGGQGVGLAFDKSKGLALGNELSGDPDFNDGREAWLDCASEADGVFFRGGTVDFVAAASGKRVAAHINASPTVTGVMYALSLNISSITSGGARDHRDFGGQAGTFTTVGVHNYFSRALGVTSPEIRNVGTTNAVVTRYSVKPVLGNYATQGTASFKPKWYDTPKRLTFDGIDDRTGTTLKAKASGSIAVRMKPTLSSRIAIGTSGASSGRCYMGIASDGSLAAGLGDNATGTIKGSASVLDTWVNGILTWDGSTVTLYQNGVSVYSGAQAGVVNTTIDVILGGLNNNGTHATFFGGDIERVVYLDRPMTAPEISGLNALWSA